MGAQVATRDQPRAWLASRGLNGTALVRCGEAVISGSRPTWARGAAATAPRWPLPRGGGERCGVCVRRRPPPRAAASAASATRASSRRRRGPGDHRGKTRGWLALSGLCQHRHCRETRRLERPQCAGACCADPVTTRRQPGLLHNTARGERTQRPSRDGLAAGRPVPWVRAWRLITDGARRALKVPCGGLSCPCGGFVCEAECLVRVDDDAPYRREWVGL